MSEQVYGYSILLPGDREVWVAKLDKGLWDVLLSNKDESTRFRLSQEAADALTSLITSYPKPIPRVRLSDGKSKGKQAC